MQFVLFPFSAVFTATQRFDLANAIGIATRLLSAGAVLLLLGTCVMLKGVAAALLLKPSFWEHWLGAGAAQGLAVGAIALLALIWLPRRAQSVICSVALEPFGTIADGTPYLAKAIKGAPT